MRRAEPKAPGGINAPGAVTPMRGASDQGASASSR